MKVLVTGGLGFIGSHLVERLLNQGSQVAVLDDGSSGSVDNIASSLDSPRLSVIMGDIRSREAVRRSLRGVEGVVHLAAKVSVEESLENPRATGEVNVDGTLVVLEECVRAKVPRFVFASSAAIYGAAKPPLDESVPPAPLSPYGASKVAGEAYCSAFHRSYGLEAVALRMFNVYGSRGTTGPYAGVMAKFADAVCAKKRLVITGDGRQTRDFVHVSDAVDGLTSAITRGGLGGEAVNIGTGTGTTINSLARLFSGFKGAKGVVHVGARTSEVRHSIADLSKAREKIGFIPKVRVAEGVDDYFRWFANARPLD